jgi:hypothetical protein
MKTRWLASVVAVGLLSGCGVIEIDFDDDRVRGSGYVTLEARRVADFRSIEVHGVGELVADVTGHRSLEIEAENNILPYLDSWVSGGVLHLGPRAGVRLDPRRPIRYFVSARRLERVELSGAVYADIAGVDTDVFRVAMSGATGMAVRGIADFQVVTLSGATTYDARDLESFEADVATSGASNVILWVREYLSADASGASSIHYFGRPVVDARVSGTAVVGPA